MQFIKESLLAASVEEVFAFHERADAFDILQPPWERLETVRPPSSLEAGTVVEVRSKIGPFWSTFVAEHVAYEKNVLFEDVMRRGPFAKWHHKHLFFEHEAGCLLRDQIEYALPLDPLSRLFDPLLVRPRLRKLFDYRHEVTRREVEAARSSSTSPPPRS